MGDSDDMELVGRYAAGDADDAFAELVRRHINLVYSVALRRLGNPHHAEEVTQAVFIILARKAASLRRGTILPGWLYQTAQLTAANFQRSAWRRERREQEALMQFIQDSETDVSWQRLQPLLEEAMSHLGEKERDAVVLRFFENQTVGEVAAALQVNEAAAQKRVNRATEKLRSFFVKRGVPVSAGVLVAAIGTNSVQAAPAGLAATVNAAAVLKGAVVGASTLTLIQGTLKIMTWTKIKISLVAVLIVLLTAGVAVVGVKYVKSVRVSHYPDIQGAWQGALSIQNRSLRLVFNFKRDNGVYHATMDSVDQGATGVVVPRFVYDYPSVKIEMPAIDVVFEGKVDTAKNEISGKFKQLGSTLPLVLKLTTEPVAVMELSEADYTPRKGSDLQGLWSGALQAGKTSLHLDFKIAETSDGTFHALLDSVDQGATSMPISSLTYERPTVTMKVESIGGSYEGDVNSDDSKITGKWKQGGKSFPLELARADAKAAASSASDYTANSSYDLPGHWHGALDVKKTQLHLNMDIARTPDGAYSCVLISVDQAGVKIPASSVEFSAPKVKMAWEGIDSKFSGELKNGKITGKWEQGKGSLPLVMERDAVK